MIARLSAYDAFFLAYQRRARIAMHLGLDLELAGALDPAALDRAVSAVIARWPELGSVVRVRALGLSYEPLPDARARIVRPLAEAEAAVDRAINEEIDPFAEPPWTVHARSEGDVHRIVLRAHHAVADGELFVMIAEEFVAALAAPSHARSVASRTAIARASLARRPSWLERLSDKRRRDERVARDEHQRLPLACVAPGPCAVTSERLDARAWSRVTQRSIDARTSVALWVIAAWVRAVHRASERGEGRVAVEVPVSVRRREGLFDRVGNYIAPVVLFVDGSAPIDRVARALRASLRSAVAMGQLETDRALAAPGSLLPWALFERVAVTPTTTGNASTHVAALGVERSPWASLSDRSQGRLELRRFVPFSPVCLKMGAALSAVCAPDEAALSVTYRRNAMSDHAARALLAQTLAELA